MLGSPTIRIVGTRCVVLFWQFNSSKVVCKVVIGESALFFVRIKSKHSTELSFSIHLNVYSNTSMMRKSHDSRTQENSPTFGQENLNKMSYCSVRRLVEKWMNEIQGELGHKTCQVTCGILWTRINTSTSQGARKENWWSKENWPWK